MKPTLVILAAGLGTRFGNKIKQLEPVGPSGEAIMDYSIHDAKAAGFDKVVFIIRKEIEEVFKERIGNRVSKIMPVSYAYQELNDLPAGFSFENRTKPWGTVHALLSASNNISGPFLVINADDYYGINSYKLAYEFLMNTDSNKYCMIGFLLRNTLSANGGVNRGICKVDNDNYLKEVIETKNIELSNGKIIGYSGSDMVELDENAYASMNMWGFLPSVFDEMYTKWLDFLNSVKSDDTTSEFQLPDFVDYLIKNKKASINVVETNDSWFGVTYEKDKVIVQKNINKLIEKGIYKENLYDIER